MAENKEYMIHQEEAGSIQISEDVLASIASTTAMEVDGVSALMSANVSDIMGGKKMTCKGVRVELDGGVLDLEVSPQGELRMTGPCEFVYEGDVELC